MEASPPGYNHLAAFLSSEKSFSVYRGFDYLHARVVLNLQDQIASLERELDGKDQIDQQNNMIKQLKSRARDIRSSQGEERSREHILDEIRQRLIHYGIKHPTIQVISISDIFCE